MNHFAAQLAAYPSAVREAAWENISAGLSGAEVWRGSCSGEPRFALKIWPTSVSIEIVGSIHNFQSALKPLNYIPQIVRTRFGQSFIQTRLGCLEISEWKMGRPVLDQKWPVSQRSLAVRALRECHHIWAQMETAAGPPPCILRRLQLINDFRTLPRLINSAIIDSNTLERMPVLLDQWEKLLLPWKHRFVPVQPCFTDIHREHVLFSDDELTGIIDFGAVKIDSPATDLARLFGDDPQTLIEAESEYGELPPGLAQLLADSAPVINLAAWIVRLSHNSYKTQISSAVRARISHWVDCLH